MMMVTRYYIDSLGNYIGGFSGEHGIDLSTYIEVESPPPVHASQKYDMVNNVWLPLETE
jgi:hypothetical protein